MDSKRAALAAGLCSLLILAGCAKPTPTPVPPTATPEPTATVEPIATDGPSAEVTEYIDWAADEVGVASHASGNVAASLKAAGEQNTLLLDPDWRAELDRQLGTLLVVAKTVSEKTDVPEAALSLHEDVKAWGSTLSLAVNDLSAGLDKSDAAMIANGTAQFAAAGRLLSSMDEKVRKLKAAQTP